MYPETYYILTGIIKARLFLSQQSACNYALKYDLRGSKVTKCEYTKDENGKSVFTETLVFQM